MESEMKDSTQETPMEPTVQPAESPRELKPWTAPAFDRMNLKDAMAGSLNVGADLGCS